MKKGSAMRTRISMGTLAFFLILTLPIHPTLATTILVPTEYSSIQSAINVANEGDLVLVSPGTYVENIEFLGKLITLRGEAGAELTVIDGSSVDTVVKFVDGETEETVIEGFTIKNGEGWDGGGIYCAESSPIIKNCNVIENVARKGGGIYCIDSWPEITNCTISENHAQYIWDYGGHGGGIGFYESMPSVRDCLIMDNYAYFSGGGVYCKDSSSLSRIVSGGDSTLVDRDSGDRSSSTSTATTTLTATRPSPAEGTTATTATRTSIPEPRRSATEGTTTATGASRRARGIPTVTDG